ncbi:carboxypeptidase-like regulatory domain-containing protein [Hufsiella ginkgonis]|uniref:Carboxypeptidase-like regulatory domain-containing protein n=1 Tax=Hufsiella ginkgonis TaxID=2695274 RepID=A0A7K1XYB5_9SPHI|nr:carboxypeptidase-like regulatory domain-containing protein [Hufsiella ginkgonis]MXV15970.1 hypothetical protein [Hufsiella ginkgonis]
MSIKFRAFLLLSLLTLAGLASAQKNTIVISGNVSAAEDRQPVPHANISINGKGIATATNTAGRFALIIPEENLGDTLKVSCIGFMTRYFPVSGLSDKQALIISLTKNVTALKEVNVIYYDAQKILQKAIARIPGNYISHPHILRGFYRMYTHRDSLPLQLSEAVFDVYNFGYGDQHADQFKLLKARSETNSRDFDMLKLGQKPNSVFEDDIINHRAASGFLSDKGIPNHQFHVTDVVDFQGYQAYEMEFKEKPGSEGATFRGKMYIDTRTFAFIYFDFGLSPSAISDWRSSNFIAHALVSAGDVTIGLKQDSTGVLYQQVGKNWVLSHVQGDHLLALNTSDGKAVLAAHVKFNYQVTAVDTVAKSSFNTKLGRGENINDYKGNDDPKFWKDYNILLSDYDAEGTFKKIQEINKGLSKPK